LDAINRNSLSILEIDNLIYGPNPLTVGSGAVRKKGRLFVLYLPKALCGWEPSPRYWISWAVSL
jgi:hypothetical protein